MPAGLPFPPGLRDLVEVAVLEWIEGRRKDARLCPLEVVVRFGGVIQVSLRGN